MTDACEIFRFAVDEDCCPPRTCKECLKDPPDQLQIDATAAILTNGDCIKCADYAELVVVDKYRWTHPYCRYKSWFDEVPQRCSTESLYNWEVLFERAGTPPNTTCWLSVDLEIIEPVHSEHYRWQTGPSPTGWDLSDWVNVPYLIRYEDLGYCEPVAVGDVRVKVA